AVWSDFSLEDALCTGDSLEVRANRALQAPYEAEERVREAMREFQTQARIVEGLLETRKERVVGAERVLEVYLAFEPRPRCDYRKYVTRVLEVIGEGGVQ
ncbi:MAG: PIG-L family deacetylase, partial [Candidatus Caldatribacterium sp.]|nr:PIG-L family deacetylase [Candidatus Caldatribacterium sp.]